MIDARLPIDAVLPDVRAALREHPRLVLAAPPGAGKTTKTPLALLDAPWRHGRILLLEPRRIAARAAAERMARSLGEKVGATVGLTTRVDRRVADKTKIEVVTDGLFTRRIIADPELSDVSAVIFDEFHERSLNIDLGLALAMEAQAALRPDLRLVLMSATIDVETLATAIDARKVESEGRSYPVDIRYLGALDDRTDVAAAIATRRALAAHDGSVLVFLPGRREIDRCAERLTELDADVAIAPLYGALAPADQDRAIAPAPDGKRKVVLATDIAESSLTIDGVHVVIDAGLARVATFDPTVGATVLSTRRAAKANVDQRAGRAGRLGPGVCYRLWDEPATMGLAAAATPEIASSDLSGLVLSLLEWGEQSPLNLFWLTPPSQGRLEAATALLHDLGAIDASGALTEVGAAMARLPMAPRMAALIVRQETPEAKALAARAAAVLSEPGLGGRSIDLRRRLEGFVRDRSPRARKMASMAANWAGGSHIDGGDKIGAVLAKGAPGWIARRRGQHGDYLLANGRAARLPDNDPLMSEEWLAIADVTGAAGVGRITAAAPIDENIALTNGDLKIEEIAEFDQKTLALRARRVKRLGAIRLNATPLTAPSKDVAAAALLSAVRESGLSLLPNHAAIATSLARLKICADVDPDGFPQITEDDLLSRLEDWLSPLLGDPPSLTRPAASALADAVLSHCHWDAPRLANELAPLDLTLPSGRKAAINYLGDGAPFIEARVQECYGLSAHPSLADGRTPVAIHLLSPAKRPVAITADLPGFWRGGYADMAKDMRSRYPKHDWPDDPATAKPHEGRTKARL